MLAILIAHARFFRSCQKSQTRKVSTAHSISRLACGPSNVRRAFFSRIASLTCGSVPSLVHQPKTKCHFISLRRGDTRTIGYVVTWASLACTGPLAAAALAAADAQSTTATDHEVAGQPAWVGKRSNPLVPVPALWACELRFDAPQEKGTLPVSSAHSNIRGGLGRDLGRKQACVGRAPPWPRDPGRPDPMLHASVFRVDSGAYLVGSAASGGSTMKTKRGPVLGAW